MVLGNESDDVSSRIVALLEQKTRDRIILDQSEISDICTVRFHIGFKYNSDLWGEADRLNKEYSSQRTTMRTMRTDHQSAAPVEECEGYRVTIEYMGYIVNKDTIIHTAAIMRAVDAIMMSRNGIEIDIDTIGLDGDAMKIFSDAFYA